MYSVAELPISEPIPVFMCRDATDPTKPCEYCIHCHEPRQHLMHYAMPPLRGGDCWAYQAHRARVSGIPAQKPLNTDEVS